MRTIAPLRRWPSVPELYEDEDPVSFVVRLTQFQLLTIKQLFGLYLGMERGNLGDLGDRPVVWQRISVITGFDLSTLERNCWRRGKSRFVVFRGRRMEGSWISDELRLAPGVMARDGETPYVRISWRFPALCCDLDTGELLLNRCPFCAAKFFWDGDLKLHRCSKCSRDLRQAEPRFATPDVLRLTRELAAAIGLIPGPELQLPFPFENLDLMTKFSVLEWCAGFGGQLRRDGMLGSKANAIHGISVARRWPQDLELAADLLFRQSRPERNAVWEHIFELRGLPTQEVRRAAKRQLRQILEKPEFATRDVFPAKGKPIFFGHKRLKAAETAIS